MHRRLQVSIGTYPGTEWGQATLCGIVPLLLDVDGVDHAWTVRGCMPTMQHGSRPRWWLFMEASSALVCRCVSINALCLAAMLTGWRPLTITLGSIIASRRPHAMPTVTSWMVLHWRYSPRQDGVPSHKANQK